MSVVAWIIFIGLCIEAGGLIVNFYFTLYKPEFHPNLYQKLDLTEMYNKSERAFYQMYSFILIISILKAVLFYNVVILMMKMTIEKPFTRFVSLQIDRLSYFTFSIGLLSYLAQQTAEKLQRQGFALNGLNDLWSDSRAFILMSAVIYIISVIFKKGIELQQENDLTV